MSKVFAMVHRIGRATRISPTFKAVRRLTGKKSLESAIRAGRVGLERRRGSQLNTNIHLRKLAYKESLSTPYSEQTPERYARIQSGFYKGRENLRNRQTKLDYFSKREEVRADLLQNKKRVKLALAKAVPTAAVVATGIGLHQYRKRKKK